MKQTLLRCLFGGLCQKRWDRSLCPSPKALSKAPPLASPPGLESQNEETGRGAISKTLGADSQGICISGWVWKRCHKEQRLPGGCGQGVRGGRALINSFISERRGARAARRWHRRWSGSERCRNSSAGDRSPGRGWKTRHDGIIVLGSSANGPGQSWPRNLVLLLGVLGRAVEGWIV